MADMTAQGVDIGNAFTAAARKSEAYNALSKAYGPAVADNPEQAQAAATAAATIPLAPQIAQTAAATGQANLANTQAELPIKQAQGQNLGVAAKSAQNSLDITAGLRGLKMMQAIANPDGSIPADEARHIVSNPIYGIDQNHIEPLIQKLSQPGGTQTLGSMAQALQAGGKVSGPATVVTNPDGTTSIYRSTVNGGEVENNIGGAQTAQQQGIPIKQQNANTAAAGLPIKQQNANTARLGYGLRENNSVYGAPGGNTLPAPSVDKIGAGNPPGSTTVPAPLFNRLPPKGKQQAIDKATGIVNAGTQLVNTNKILDTVDQQISPYTTGTGALLKSLPGSAQANLKANLSTLKAGGLMAFIQSVKSGGPGGTGGLRLASEANAAMNLFGNMEQDQTAKQLAFHAQLFRQAVNSLYQHQNQAYSSMYGVQPHEAMGAQDPMAAPASPQDIVDELRKRGAVK